MTHTPFDRSGEVYYYDPTPVDFDEEEREYRRVIEQLREHGARVVDQDGNVIGSVGPARVADDGTLVAPYRPRDDEGEPASAPAELDPRWEWTEVRRMCDVAPTYIKGRCLHTEVVTVEAGGEVVAQLCQTCDTQLPAQWQP